MSAKDVLDKMFDGRTLVFGHRGASVYAPMNTIPAFELALEQGADGIELDVHRTKDGHLVIVHDFEVDSTTDGNGTVQQMTLAELKALDAGNWFDPKFAGTPIPTLAEVFDAVGQSLYVNVEIKSITQETDGLESLIADEIRKYNMQERVIVSSFNPYALIRFRDLMPEVPIGFLYATGFMENVWSLMDDLPHEARHPNFMMIDADYMRWAKAHDYRVGTWTVNDLERAVELRDLGVDVLMTDKPTDVIRALNA
ncbi:MAG: glycerophosphodiester phosphodiesterase [Aggregatilineales bacterium]